MSRRPVVARMSAIVSASSPLTGSRMRKPTKDPAVRELVSDLGSGPAQRRPASRVSRRSLRSTSVRSRQARRQQPRRRVPRGGTREERMRRGRCSTRSELLGVVLSLGAPLVEQLVDEAASGVVGKHAAAAPRDVAGPLEPDALARLVEVEQQLRAVLEPERIADGAGSAEPGRVLRSSPRRACGTYRHCATFLNVPQENDAEVRRKDANSRCMSASRPRLASDAVSRAQTVRRERTPTRVRFPPPPLSLLIDRFFRWDRTLNRFACQRMAETDALDEA